MSFADSDAEMAWYLVERSNEVEVYLKPDLWEAMRGEQIAGVKIWHYQHCFGRTKMMQPFFRRHNAYYYTDVLS